MNDDLDTRCAMLENGVNININNIPGKKLKQYAAATAGKVILLLLLLVILIIV